MTHIKSLIFDLDGTLIHSAPDIHAAINAALKSIGRDALSLETVISFIGNGVETLVARSLRHTGEATPALQTETLATFLEHYNADPSSRTAPYPGVIDSLRAYQKAGYALAVCTNKPVETAREICEALDLAQYFAVISGAMDGVPKKPDATPLLTVAAELGASPAQTLYIGDSAVDQETAHNAEVPFVLFGGGYLNSPLKEPAPLHTFQNWSEDWLSETCHKIPLGKS